MATKKKKEVEKPVLLGSIILFKKPKVGWGYEIPWHTQHGLEGRFISSNPVYLGLTPRDEDKSVLVHFYSGKLLDSAVYTRVPHEDGYYRSEDETHRLAIANFVLGLCWNPKNISIIHTRFNAGKM